MLEMMPGSIIDKTNNNLNNLACTHSTIEQKTDLEKEKMSDVTKMVKNSTVPSTIDETLSKDTLEGSDTSTECSNVTNQFPQTLQNSNACSIINKNVFERNSELQKAADCRDSKNNVASLRTADCDTIFENNTENSIIPQESSINYVYTQEKKCKDSSESNCSTHSDMYLEKESTIPSEISENIVFSQEMTIQCNLTDTKVANSEELSNVTPENVCDSNVTSQTISEDDKSEKQFEKSISENVSKEKTEHASTFSRELQDKSEDKVIPEELGSIITSSITSETENIVEEKSEGKIFSSMTIQDNVSSFKLLKDPKFNISTVVIPEDEAVVNEKSVIKTSLLVNEKNDVIENIDLINIFEEKIESNASTVISENKVECEENPLSFKSIVDSPTKLENNITNEEKLEFNTSVAENKVIFEEKNLPSYTVEPPKTSVNMHCVDTFESNYSPQAYIVCQETESNILEIFEDKIVDDSEIFEQGKPASSSTEYIADSYKSFENKINEKKLEMNISNAVTYGDETVFGEIIVTSMFENIVDSPETLESNEEKFVSKNSTENEVFEEKSSTAFENTVDSSENNINIDDSEYNTHTVDTTENENVLEEITICSIRNIVDSPKKSECTEEKLESTNSTENELFGEKSSTEFETIEYDINKDKSEYNHLDISENKVVLEEKSVFPLKNIVELPKTIDSNEGKLESKNSTENQIFEKKSSVVFETIVDSSKYNINKDESEYNNDIVDISENEAVLEEKSASLLKDIVHSHKTPENNEEKFESRNSTENEVLEYVASSEYDITNNYNYNKETVLEEISTSPIKDIVESSKTPESNEEKLYSKNSTKNEIFEEKSLTAFENIVNSSEYNKINKGESDYNSRTIGTSENETVLEENFASPSFKNVDSSKIPESNTINEENINTAVRSETETITKDNCVNNITSFIIPLKDDAMVAEDKVPCTKILDSDISFATMPQKEVAQEKTENEMNSLVITGDIVDLHISTNNITKEKLECSNILVESSGSNIVSAEINQNEDILFEHDVILHEALEIKNEACVEKITNNVDSWLTTKSSIILNKISKNENNTIFANSEDNVISKTSEAEIEKFNYNKSVETSTCDVSNEKSKYDDLIASPEKSEDNKILQGISQELLKCINTTEELIDQKIEKVTQESDISLNEDVSSNLENELHDSIESKFKNSKEMKLSLFLQKHNITLQYLLPKLKHVKRQTKDKRSNSVLSLKLNRFYFKSNKPKWSKQMSAEKKRKLKDWYHEEKKKLKRNSLKHHSSSESENDQDEIITSCQGSDDVRNKIKQQLELLRQQRKPVVNPDENKIVTSSPKPPEKVKEVLKEIISEIDTANHSKLVSADLDDVVLSKGDGGLSIVSVVGGYISDEDIEQEQNVSETVAVMDDESSIVQLTPLNKGVSITDILLKRELSSNNVLDTHVIKPSKTNDITKIKGWKTKQFAAIPVPDNVYTENKLLEKQDKFEESVLKKKTPENQTSNTIENPLPSTSFGYCELTERNNPQIDTDSKPDNILKQGETTDLENNTKSAFVSDMLDTFLSNHAQLKISYEVPKLVAEEAITKPISEMPVRNNEYLSVINKTSYRKKTISGKVLKPKTLAEKRRMLEQDRQNQLLQTMESNESMYLKKLEYCEKKNKTEVVKDILDTMMDEKVPFSRHCWNIATKFDENARQFIVVNGNKIRIQGSPGGKDIIMPNEVTRIVPIKESCPPLLFSRKRKIYYKPGPLSKKHKLMIGENSENWECRVLKMPKIKLIVCPEQGKRLPILAEQYLQLYRGEKGIISDELAKFAVSAVRSQEEVKRNFEFEIPYQNAQEKLLIRRKKLLNKTQDKSNENKKEESHSHPHAIPRSEFSNINVEKCIKNIMSDMLTCVENRDLDKEIIKDDPDENTIIINDEKHADRPPSPIDPRVQAVIKRANARKRGTTLELRRLNVQVIEVDVKEDENESQVCTKDFCKLGCICKSLRGSRSLVPEHCGRESCMLQCNCSFGNSQRGHHSITLPAGTDLFSASTVVRLQDEVKKNLAKEEREFAQTVIKANNQTIMVGGGARERQRRIPKVPKKYSNFVSKNKGFSYEKMISVGLLEEDEDFEVQMGKAAIQRAKESVKKDTEQRVLEVELKKSVPIWNKKDKLSNKGSQEMRECCIKLTKLSLPHIVPWCMVHNLYKCHCDGRALFEPFTLVKPREEIVANAAEYNEYIPYASRGPGRYFPENNTSVTVTDTTDKYCARTRALATNYYQARNKSQRFKAQYAKIRKDDENQSVYFDAMKPTEDEVKNINVGGPELKVRKLKTKRYSRQIDYRGEINSSDSQDLLIPKHNKKITLVNVDDILNTSNKEESPKPVPATNPCQVVSAASFIDYDRSFLALLTPSTEWLDRFHKMLNLNLNTVIRQIRLLEWATLVRRHSGGVLQLWFNSKKYNNIILTEDRRRPSKYHINIKLFESTPPMTNYKLPEIITSLFNNKLPGVAKKDTETYVILVYNGIFWEARGTIVLNDTYEMCLQKLGHKPTPGNILDPTLSYNQNDKPVQSKSVPTNSNIVIRSTSSISVEVVSRNTAMSVSNKQIDYSGLEITKIPLSNQSTESSMKQNGSILAPLPTGFGLNRWFMLILKNDFSVLRISFSNFHIKYTHLMTAIQTARKNQKTVRIRSQEKHIENPNNFGVYAIPGCGDRIFFGPYDNESSHGLETFRYVNGKLVNTKIYNKMRGNIDKNTTGIWYYHSSTLQNNLILEPQNDNRSSGSDCSTEMTSAEKAVKPQIEFVDLTENDSDNEKEENEKTAFNVDPLFNVLSADFTKKVSGDITIEPVFDNVPKPAPVVKEINDIVIQPIRNDNTSITSASVVKTELITKEQVSKTSRKRKSAGNSLLEPSKKQPTLIDSINLDEDDGSLLKKKSISPKRRSLDAHSVKQMPALCPINTLQNLNNEVLKKRKIIYVITNIPGIGYFEIYLTEKRSMRLNINGKANMFPTISTALTWLHQLFRRFIFFIPSDLKVKFSILESTEIPEMPKFNEEFLNGYHIMCAKGIFDLIRLSAEDMDSLDFNDQETSTVLAHKCELLIERNIRILGNCMMGPEEARKLDKARILQIAPKKIELLESRESFLLEEKTRLQNEQSNLMGKLNSMIGCLPEHVKKMYRDKVNSILNLKVTQFVSDQNVGECYKDESPKFTGSILPGGKICKIVDGKMFVMDGTPQMMSTMQTPVIYNKQQLRTIAPKPQFEMLVPIAGLQSPVTLIGVPPQQVSATSILLSNNRKNAQRVVDLTDD